jgi:urea carboxylase-associated protein 2
LGEGRLLLSDMGRVLMSIVRDTCGKHDAFAGCSNSRTNAARYGEGDNHTGCPSGRDRLLLALAKHGLGRKDLMPNINLFKGLTIEADGSLTYEERSSVAGEYIELRCEMDVLVAMANTPHPLDERTEYAATPVRILAWREAPTDEADPIRNATPEALRAFQNTEDYLER